MRIRTLGGGPSRAKRSSAELVRRGWKRQLTKINSRALDYDPAFVDSEAEAAILGKESQSIAAAVRVNSSFAPTGDFTFAQALQKERWLDPESIGDNRRIDLNAAIFEFKRFHFLHRVAGVSSVLLLT